MKLKGQIILMVMAFALCMAFTDCNGRRETPAKANPVHQKSVVSKAAKSGKPKPLYIYMYRYDDFPVAKAKYLCRELEKVYPSVILVKTALPLPAKEYYKKGNRYRAAGLLDDLERFKNGGFALGMTDEIIYHPNEKSPTWGIFGLGRTGKNVCVISSMRPKERRLQSDDNMRKLMLHELGHAFGLNHCKDQHCFMVDAEHGDKFDQTPAFCDDCKRYLNSKGWKL